MAVAATWLALQQAREADAIIAQILVHSTNVAQLQPDNRTRHDFAAVSQFFSTWAQTPEYRTV